MAHIGSYVPAEKCKLGTVDKILTLINVKKSKIKASQEGQTRNSPKYEEIYALSKIFK